MDPKVGDTVKYAIPLNPEEAEFRFTLIEHNGDRVLIRWICDPKQWPIAPVSCIRPSEIVKA